MVVVGGGLTGLAAAAEAADRGASVALVDRDERGGRAATDVAGSFKLNRGAHALFPSSRAVLERFGLRPKGHRPSTRIRLRLAGELVPASRFFTRPEILRVFAGLRRWSPEQLATVSATTWLADLDLRPDSGVFVETMLRTATYAADSSMLSADAAVASLRAAMSVSYLDGGWEQIVRGLHRIAEVRGVRQVRRRAAAIEPGIVRTEEGDLRSRAIVVAAGGPDACSSLLPERPLAWDELGPPSRVACLDLGVTQVPRVGLVLDMERPLYLSRHCPPAELAPRGAAVVHVMRYLRPGEDLPADVARRELVEHARTVRIDPDHAVQARYLHHMTACCALPLAEQGGLRGRPGVQTGITGVFVAGDWIGPHGLLADAALTSGVAAGAAAAAG